jgi:hypothetical protein
VSTLVHVVRKFQASSPAKFDSRDLEACKVLRTTDCARRKTHEAMVTAANLHAGAPRAKKKLAQGKCKLQAASSYRCILCVVPPRSAAAMMPIADVPSFGWVIILTVDTSRGTGLWHRDECVKSVKGERTPRCPTSEFLAQVRKNRPRRSRGPKRTVEDFFVRVVNGMLRSNPIRRNRGCRVCYSSIAGGTAGNLYLPPISVQHLGGEKKSQGL